MFLGSHASAQESVDGRSSSFPDDVGALYVTVDEFIALTCLIGDKKARRATTETHYRLTAKEWYEKYLEEARRGHSAPKPVAKFYYHDTGKFVFPDGSESYEPKSASEAKKMAETNGWDLYLYPQEDTF